MGGFNVPPPDYPRTCVGGRLRDGVLTQIGSEALGVNNRGQLVGARGNRPVLSAEWLSSRGGRRRGVV
ncbi:hypothetical protein AB0C06_23685 [Micromonospora inaquosa]|uniref:hypothetical protein n=1 Tax=Micromonospora inaquosa TaxID=2203716 RepID=UPI00131586A0